MILAPTNALPDHGQNSPCLLQRGQTIRGRYSLQRGHLARKRVHLHQSPLIRGRLRLQRGLLIKGRLHLQQGQHHPFPNRNTLATIAGSRPGHMGNKFPLTPRLTVLQTFIWGKRLHSIMHSLPYHPIGRSRSCTREQTLASRGKALRWWQETGNRRKGHARMTTSQRESTTSTAKFSHPCIFGNRA